MDVAHPAFPEAETYLNSSKDIWLDPRSQSTVQRALVPHEKSILIVPVLTLLAQLQIKGVQELGKYQPDLVISHAVARQHLSTIRSPNRLCSLSTETHSRPKRKGLKPLLVV